jgi:hypothetical protein
VSKVSMTRQDGLFIRTVLLLLSCFPVLSISARGQALAGPQAEPEVAFWVVPAEQLLRLDEPVVLVISLYNSSERPLFVNNLQHDDFVDFKVIGPDGEEVPWQSKHPVTSSVHSPSDFMVLEKYHEVSVKKVISLKDGTGFVFDKPGQYSITAQYSLGPPETFASLAGNTKIPTGPLRSTKATFCIEVCITGSELAQNHVVAAEPGQARNNPPQAALDVVHTFYNNVKRHPPLGIPEGRAKTALRPLMSKRLVWELDSLQACDDDYFRRYGDFLKANIYKPATPWLEVGLFTGPNDAADFINFSILDSRTIGKNRVDVHLKFVHDWGLSDGLVTVILEDNRWLVDDFIAMYENDELTRLSDGYSECKNGKWVGLTPY